MAANGHSNGANGASDLADWKYIRWDAEGVEKVPPEEEEDIRTVAKMFNDVQRMNFNAHRHVYGGTHARTHGLVKGTFIVPDDLPQHLKQTELFEKGGEYPVVARYSSESPDPGADDHLPQPRGFAMKLFNVHGEMLDAGKDFPTQDIEFNSHPTLELANAKVAKEIVDLRIKYAFSDPAEYNRQLEKRDDTAMQKKHDEHPPRPLESIGQYSQTAYRFGDYVCKYRIIPSTTTQKNLADKSLKPEDGPDILHRWLQNFYKEHDAEYEFQVQLLENLEDQPVEYSGKDWDKEKYPWQTVAKVVFPKQESFDFERKAFWEDHMRIDPWHGLKSLQPLGGTNRLRKIVYPASSALRRKMNGRKEINVKNIDEIP